MRVGPFALLLLLACCEFTRPAPEITLVVPSEIEANATTTLEIRGKNFFIEAQQSYEESRTVRVDDGFEVLLGGRVFALSVDFNNSGLLLAQVRVESTGDYNVSVTTPGGQTAFWSEHLRVVEEFEGIDASDETCYNDADDDGDGAIDAAETACDWNASWNSSDRFGWSRRQKLIIQGTVKSNLVAVPVLVLLGPQRFDYDDTASTGLRFIDPDSNKRLPYEVESWRGADDVSRIWLRVPEMQPDKELVVWLYSGNPSAPFVALPPVWDDVYVGVWHFADADGSSPAANAAQLQTKAFYSGFELEAFNADDMAGTGAVHFDGSDSVVRTDELAIAGDAITVEVVAKADSPDQGGTLLQSSDVHIFVSAVDGGSDSASLSVRALFDVVLPASLPGITMPSTWFYAVATYNGTTAKLTLPGTEISTSDVASGSLASSLINIGADLNGTNVWSGWISELRVSKVARSNDWLSVQSQGLSDPGTDAGTSSDRLVQFREIEAR